MFLFLNVKYPFPKCSGDHQAQETFYNSNARTPHRNLEKCSSRCPFGGPQGHWPSEVLAEPELHNNNAKTTVAKPFGFQYALSSKHFRCVSVNKLYFLEHGVQRFPTYALSPHVHTLPTVDTYTSVVSYDRCTYMDMSLSPRVHRRTLGLTLGGVHCVVHYLVLSIVWANVKDMYPSL